MKSAKELRRIDELGLSKKTARYFGERFTLEQLVFLARESDHYRRPRWGKMNVNGRDVIVSKEKMLELTARAKAVGLIREDLSGDLAGVMECFLEESFGERKHYSIWQRGYSLNEAEVFNREYEKYVPIKRSEIFMN